MKTFFGNKKDFFKAVLSSIALLVSISDNSQADPVIPYPDSLFDHQLHLNALSFCSDGFRKEVALQDGMNTWSETILNKAEVFNGLGVWGAGPAGAEFTEYLPYTFTAADTQNSRQLYFIEPAAEAFNPMAYCFSGKEFESGPYYDPLNYPLQEGQRRVARLFGSEEDFSDYYGAALWFQYEVSGPNRPENGTLISMESFAAETRPGYGAKVEVEIAYSIPSRIPALDNEYELSLYYLSDDGQWVLHTSKALSKDPADRNKTDQSLVGNSRARDSLKSPDANNYVFIRTLHRESIAASIPYSTVVQARVSSNLNESSDAYNTDLALYEFTLSTQACVPDMADGDCL